MSAELKLNHTMPQSSFRFDRAVSIHLMHAASRLNSARQPCIPILMYHGIATELSARHPYFEINTSPTVFARHLEFLFDNGYTPIHLGEAVEAVASAHSVEKRVVLTFDDGYRDFYTSAFPVLARYRFKATVFVVAGFTGEERVSQEGEEFMTWDEVRETQSHGIEIGCHTMTHPQLYSLHRSEIESEIMHSKCLLEDTLGRAVESFAYPFAFPEQDREFVGTLKQLLQTHGYRNGVTTIIGTAHRGHDPFCLPRIPVNTYDDLRLFKAKLDGGYDWLHRMQLAKKYLKRLV